MSDAPLRSQLHRLHRRLIAASSRSLLCVRQVYAELPASADGSAGGYRVLKLLSEDPANYADAPREAIRRVLESVTGIPHPIDQPLDTSRIEVSGAELIHGTCAH